MTQFSAQETCCVQTSARLTASLILATRKYCPPFQHTKSTIDVISHYAVDAGHATQFLSKYSMLQAKISRFRPADVSQAIR